MFPLTIKTNPHLFAIKILSNHFLVVFTFNNCRDWTKGRNIERRKTNNLLKDLCFYFNFLFLLKKPYTNVVYASGCLFMSKSFYTSEALTDRCIKRKKSWFFIPLEVSRGCCNIKVQLTVSWVIKGDNLLFCVWLWRCFSRQCEMKMSASII